MPENSLPPAGLINLNDAVILIPPDSDKLVRKAAQVLAEEVYRRTRIPWPITSSAPRPDTPTIVLGQADQNANQFIQDEQITAWVETGTPTPADGFRIHTTTLQNAVKVYVLGNDARGVLFGAGYLLRRLSIKKGSVSLADAIEINTFPHYSLRGHQLGYRDKTNAYDGWDLPQWDQYMRELAIFGTNAIELIPPRSDDRADSVHFPLPPMEMMAGMSNIADQYGLDVWIWYPAMDDDYSREEMVAFALNEWEEVFKRLPRIDALLVPGGDPGNTRPRYLLPMLARQTESLHRYHPKAQMWVSAQGFNQEWMDEFLAYLRDESPDWMSGVVYGPWIHMPIHEFRGLIPAKYPIRSYPDITHSLDCQYPVAEWDIAYALTEGRETINPRPAAEAAIFKQMGEDVIGFLTYSEGCNDDVNKFLWSGLGWDPRQDAHQILREFSRFFIGEEYTNDYTLGLAALEQNWVGPLLANTGVVTTLAQFQAMEKSAAPSVLQNWRFQQGLYRAYYDAYIQSRLRYETALEEQAMDRLRQAQHLGALPALSAAEAILEQAVLSPINTDWRTRIFQLAEALFQSIHMQLSVPLYAAQSETRGANLDGLDYPLNDRPWLLERFAAIRAIPDEHDRLAQIERILNWRSPGPGGYYLDLSNTYDSLNVVQGPPYEQDPAFYSHPHRRFPYWKDSRPLRRAWRAYTGGLNEYPLQLRFPHLDPAARYRVRVVYSDTEPEIKIRLVANDNIEIHPFIFKPNPPAPQEFDIPAQALQTGELCLSLYREPGLGGLGAGHEICEIWIIKQD